MTLVERRHSEPFANSPYAYLLTNPQFKRWVENLARGSQYTASNWFRQMGMLHKDYEVDPVKLASMTQKEATNFTLDLVGKLEREGQMAVT